MSGGPVRVLIVEDHPVFRRGLRDTLAGEPGLDLVAEAATLREALAAVDRARPTLVLADLQLPDGSGLDLVAALAGRRPPVPVLVLSAHPQRAYVAAAVERGAAGYLLKDEPPARIVEALREVARGRTGCFSGAVRGELRRAEVDPLTPKETEVVTLLAQGNSLSQLARTLGISRRTAGNHLASVYAKLDLHRQSELVAWAWKNGLAGPG